MLKVVRTDELSLEYMDLDSSQEMSYEGYWNRLSARYDVRA